MEPSKKPGTDTGSGDGKTPILAKGQPATAGKLKPSRKPTSIDGGSTKPVSLPEALSLLQTNCYDLRSMGCTVSILARKNRVYIIAEMPPNTGRLDVENGHITIAGKPVLLG